MVRELDERDKKILFTIVNTYIKTGQPVGSRTVAKSFGFSISPATVRNVMSDLRDMGLLDQPHTSAGRVPTDQGFKYYVSHVLGSHRLSREEKDRIRSKLNRLHADHPSAAEEAGRLLAELCKQASVVMTTDAEHLGFKHMQFVILREGQILGILVDEAGTVHNKLMEIDFNVTQADLDRAGNYLTRSFSGMSLFEARQRLMDDLSRHKNEYDKILRRAVELGQALLEQSMNTNVMLLGEENIFEHPDFAEIDKLKTVYKAFHEKQFLIKLLDAAIQARKTRIFIGSECSYNDCTEVGVVAVPFGPGNEYIGGIGVIGPKRMDYPRIIPMVSYTAEILGEIFEGC